MDTQEDTAATYAGNTERCTEGEYLVGVDFNPGGLDSVRDIKAKAAALIDCVCRHGADQRTRALAIAAIEEGAMWGVKSATKPPR